MTDTFGGSVAVITGASGNLGRAVADAFVAAGARVGLVDRRAGGAVAETGLSGERFGVAADLLDAGSARAAADAIFARWGRIDVLCNIAGGFTMGAPVHTTPEEVWRRMFDLNVLTAVHMCAGVVPRMIAAGRGAIVNVSAASSVRGGARMAAYAVAKSGVARLTESMAAELAPHGISATCIMPTTIDTPENRSAMPHADMTTWTPAAELADVILRMAAPQALLFSGVAVPIQGRLPVL